MDAIYGMTMETLAETMTKHGELRAKFGEQQGMSELSSWLQARGFDLHTWSLANNAWQDRFRADPTGRAEARFHQLLAQGTAKAHFGDVRDMSQDTEEGITLDQYAQITVAVSRQGADADAIVRQFGLSDVAHWQRANGAWTKKMGEDHTHKLTMQFGQLYQKYAGPSFQNEMLDQSAAILAQNNAPKDVISEPQEELTPDLCLRKMESPSQNERWKYARRYAHFADLGNVPDKAVAIARVRPILVEMIERHDEHTTSDAEDGARKLWDLGVRDDDFRGAVGRCLNRAEDKLRSLQAAFAPIQNQAVPERVTLQSRIQDFTSLIDTMRGYQNEQWVQHVSAPSMGPANGPSFPPNQGWSTPSMAAQPRPGGGFPKSILVLLILLFVGGGFFATRGRAMLAAHRAAAAAQASVSASAVPPPPPVAAKVPAAPPPAVAAAAPATSGSAAPAKAAAKGKKKK
jgi:hypothetical protein